MDNLKIHYDLFLGRDSDNKRGVPIAQQIFNLLCLFYLKLGAVYSDSIPHLNDKIYS